jgi:CRISPR/Cas system-associated exonuclease Cas4 (RecB family)
MGHICEAGVNAELQNRMSGIEGRGIREEMLKVMDDVLPRIRKEEEREQVRAEFDPAIKCVELYIEQIDYTPLRVQEYFNFHMDVDDMEHPVKGCIDIIAERNGQPLVIDLKRKKSPIKRDNYGYRMQVALYSLWLMQARTLDEIPSTEIHVMVSGKKPQVWNVNVTVEDMYEAVYRLRDLGWRLANNYFPMARGHPLCSPKWCNFWDQCHIDNFQGLDELLSKIKP